MTVTSAWTLLVYSFSNVLPLRNAAMAIPSTTAKTLVARIFPRTPSTR
jgi:hypothetical protein